MHQIQNILSKIDSSIGGSQWFVLFLLLTGIFFTIYLKFPQIRYFKHAIKILTGVYDKKDDKGDTTHFQALTTALSGTVGTGNIAGVALAIHLGGPAAIFWMWITAMLGMTTKFVEVTLSHKYRDFSDDGTVSGGPMYFMKKRLNIPLKNGKVIKTGVWMGSFFAIATIFSSFGTGSLPQINSISNALFDTFNLNKIITGGVLAIILGLVILGGIQRIAKVTSRLVPTMAIFYLIGAFAVLIANHQNIIPSIMSIFSDVFTGSSAVGGFLGASIAFAFNRGVNRGLFSNEAGQGSAPIAHASARAHEPVSEGMVALLEPFIDTIIICSLTALVILSSGVWNQKLPNTFQMADIEVLSSIYHDNNPVEINELRNHINNKKNLPFFDGKLKVINGQIEDSVTLINSRSVADNVLIQNSTGELYNGLVEVKDGKIQSIEILISGESLLHSAPLTTRAFNTGIFGSFGQYIVAIGLLLFAFSTAISWSYYGDRAVTYLWGVKYVFYYRVIYIIGFFIAAFTDTTIVWIFSGITIAFMTIPNLIGILVLHRDVKNSINEYWEEFK